MAVWRCPHCATPQSEAARCWVCHRSTTSCGTCRHFRRSIASGLGICGLDPRHVALTGAEMRACWTSPGAILDEDDELRRLPAGASPAGVAPAGVAPPGVARADPGMRVPRTFVPVEELVVAQAPAVPSTATAAPIANGAPLDGGGWSLWGDAER